MRTTLGGLLLALAVAATAPAGDPAAGERVFSARCAFCHSATAGRNGTGPSLFGVVGRKAGQAPDYRYSDANRTADVTFDAATLEKYLTSPRAVIPGTKKSFSGLKSAAQRDDVIAYLATLH
ncbi:MAG: c-type cytochrome [Alphaproteobacteria bacterium]|nr:c-type cytochrome [Alphaproteobacteria bacterium]